MVNNKKGIWFKGFLSAIFVAIFCFVLSLCVTGSKESKVEAANGGTPSASSFTARFSINESLSKPITVMNSTIYGGYSFLQNNDLVLDFNYNVNCGTTSDVDEIEKSIQEWKEILEEMESCGIKDFFMYGGDFYLILQQMADKYNTKLENLNKDEEAEFIVKGSGQIALGIIETYGLMVVKVFLNALAAKGLLALGYAIPVVGWVVFAIDMLVMVIHMIATIVKISSLNGLAKALESELIIGAITKYNYCINAYDYISDITDYVSYEEDDSDTNEKLGFNFMLDGATASYTIPESERIVTNQRRDYKGMTFYESIMYNVSAYTMKISVSEKNGLPLPKDFSNWTDFFFPGYNKTFVYKDSSGNVIKDTRWIAAGDRTDALFCDTWDEKNKVCTSTNLKKISNETKNFKTQFDFGKNSEQGKILNQGIYNFEFDVQLIPVGMETISYNSATQFGTPIKIDNMDIDKLQNLYDEDGFMKFGATKSVSNKDAKDYCRDVFTENLFDNNGNYLGQYEMYDDYSWEVSDNYVTDKKTVKKLNKKKKAAAVKNIGNGEIIICGVPKLTEKGRSDLDNATYYAKKGNVNLESTAKDKVYAYLLSLASLSDIRDENDKNESATLKKFATLLINRIVTTAKDQVKKNNYCQFNENDYYCDSSDGASEYGKDLGLLRLIAYIDFNVGSLSDTQNSSIQFIIDQTNPYAPGLEINHDGTTDSEDLREKDIVYSQGEVALVIGPSEKLTNNFGNFSGDVVTYFNKEGLKIPENVDGAAPGSGVVGYMYKVFYNVDTSLVHEDDGFNAYINAINSSEGFAYKWCKEGSYDNGVYTCTETVFGEASIGENASITYGDTTDWLSFYSSSNGEFENMRIKESEWTYTFSNVLLFDDEGLYYVVVMAVDYAGNIGPASGVKFIIDGTKPMIDITTLKGDGSEIYDSNEQLDNLRNEEGYYVNGYVLSRSTIETLKITLYDKELYGSGVDSVDDVDNVDNTDKIKTCVSYLSNPNSEFCLGDFYDNGTIKDKDKITTTDNPTFFYDELMVYRYENRYIIAYKLTDGLGDVNSGGSATGPFRVNIYVEDRAGNVNKLTLLVISNIENWEIKPETETNVVFDFTNDVNPIKDLSVILHFPKYVIDDELSFDLGDEKLMTQRYMLVGAEDRYKFYTNWDKYISICEENPNDVRCGRDVVALKDRFTNITPSHNIVDLLTNTDDLYENQYLFQHFQIKIPGKEDNASFYVLFQEFEFSTDDLISQLGFVKDGYGKLIGSNLSEDSFDIISTTNNEIRFSYIDYGKFISNDVDGRLTNFNYMDEFTLSFDLMQLGISNPIESTIYIKESYILEFSLNSKGEINQNVSAGSFKWIDDNWNIGTYTQNFVKIDENGHPVYYFYVNFSDYATSNDFGVSYAIDNIKFNAIKYNGILGSSKDYTKVDSSYLALRAEDEEGNYKDTWLDGHLYVKMTSQFTSGFMYDAKYYTFDKVKDSNDFTFYYKNNDKFVEIPSKSVNSIKEAESGDMVYNYAGTNFQVYAKVTLYLYFDTLYLPMNDEYLYDTYRYNESVKLVYKNGEDEYTIASALAVEKYTDKDTNKETYIFPDLNKQVYILFNSTYVEISSDKVWKIFSTAMDMDEDTASYKDENHNYRNIYIKTISESDEYSLKNSYTLFSSVDSVNNSYLEIYTNYETTRDEPTAIPGTGTFEFSESMGSTPNMSKGDSGLGDVYWSNSTVLAFELKNIQEYDYSHIFGPTLKYQYGVIPTSELTLERAIALYAYYNNIDLMTWLKCDDSSNNQNQCIANIETIKNSILNDYYNSLSGAYKSKIDQYIKLNGISKQSLDMKQLMAIGAYTIDYQLFISKAFLKTTNTLFNLLDKAAGVTDKEAFILDKFNTEIEKRNDSLDSANTEYKYRNYYYDSDSGDYKYMVKNILTIEDLYANAMALYMNNISESSWSSAEYCYIKNEVEACSNFNSTGVIDASALVPNFVDGEYVIVYRSIDALGRGSLNYKVIHFFSDVPSVNVTDITEIDLTDSSTFYSPNSQESTLNLDNLQDYLFGKKNSNGEYEISPKVSKWFNENDTFFMNLENKEICLVNEDSSCSVLTNDIVISMEINKVYYFQFTLTDKAGNTLVLSAPFKLIYNVKPRFEITISNNDKYTTNKDVNVSVQYRSIAGLDYDRSILSITDDKLNVIDYANGVFYIDLSDYNYSANGGTFKNGTITSGRRVIDIYGDDNAISYSNEFISFLDGMTLSNHLLIDNEGYYFNVNEENRTYIFAVVMTKPIQSSVTDVGRTVVYSDIISVDNIDVSAPVVSFDDQYIDRREFVGADYYFNTPSVLLYIKDEGVGISNSNLSYVSVKPVNTADVCDYEDKVCIANAFASMNSVPSLLPQREGDNIVVDLTPNPDRPGLITYYLSIKDDLGNVVYYRYDIQIDRTAPVVDVATTYISELDENGFVQTPSINIVFNSIQDGTLNNANYEVSSPLDKIVILEKEIGSTSDPIETIIQCNGQCSTTMQIPYVVRNNKVNLVLSLYDIAGNKSSDFTMTVTIDSLKPTLNIEVRSDLEKITNEPVNVLVNATDNFSFYNESFTDIDGVLHYDIEVRRSDSLVWERIKNNYEYQILSNGTYIFRANDMARNFVEVEVVVENIDITAPNLVFSPNGGPEAQSHTIKLIIEDDLSHIDKIRYCWVTVNSNIVECNYNTSGAIEITTLGNETRKEISIIQNTGEKANPDGDYIMVVHVSDEWGNGKTYVSNVYKLNSKKPSIVPNQSLVSDSSVAIYNEKLSTEKGVDIYESTLTIVDSNNLSHLMSNKAMVAIPGETAKELVGQWVSGIDGDVLSSPVAFDNIFVKDGAYGDYYYLKFTSTYEDYNGDVQSEVVYLIVHVIDRSIPQITLIQGADTIDVKKEGNDYEVPGISINDINEGTLHEDISFRSIYFIKYGEYVPTIEELEADMQLTTRLYIPYSSNTTISIKEIGTYLIHYVAVDSSGNKSTTLRTIEIVDEVAPVLLFTNPLVVEKFIYVADPEKSFDIYDYATISDNYDELTSEDVTVVYEYRTQTGTYNVTEYKENSLQVIGYHRFTYTLVDSSGNETVVVRELNTTNIEIKYTNGELTGTDVSLAENDSFIIKGGVRIRTNGLIVTINDKPIDSVATVENIGGEVYYQYTANGKQNVKVVDDMGNENTYSLYMVKIDELNPEDDTQLRVLIDKHLVVSSKQIVASSADFIPNVDKDGNIISYSISLNAYNVNVDGMDAYTKVGNEDVQNVILFSLFCDNVKDNGGVKCSSNYLELTLQGKTMNSSSAIKLTEVTNSIVFSVAEYENIINNGDRIVMLLVTKEEASKVENVDEIIENKKISKSSISSMVLFGVPSVIGLVAILRVLKFKKSVKSV